MNEKEFQKQLKNEMETGVSQAQLSKVMNAFDERQARSSKHQKKIFRARNLTIFAATAATVMAAIILCIILLPGGGGAQKQYLTADTPFLSLTSLEEIKDHTDIDIKLPFDFDEGYTLQEVKVYYIKENQPCGIGIVYAQPPTEYDYPRIKITIMLDDDVLFFEEPKYNDCNTQGVVGQISYVYSLEEVEESTICEAKFKVNQKDYFYEAYDTNESMLALFISYLK